MTERCVCVGGGDCVTKPPSMENPACQPLLEPVPWAPAFKSNYEAEIQRTDHMRGVERPPFMLDRACDWDLNIGASALCNLIHMTCGSAALADAGKRL